MHVSEGKRCGDATARVTRGTGAEDGVYSGRDSSEAGVGYFLPPWSLVERLQIAIANRPPTIKITCGTQPDAMSPQSLNLTGANAANNRANPKRIEMIAP